MRPPRPLSFPGALLAPALLLVAAPPWPGGADPLAAQAPPDTDVLVLPLEEDAAGLRLGPPVRVTDRAGYDNQPAFLPDGTLLFTSVDSTGQADTWRWRPDDGRPVRWTRTPESEYSPTPLPGGERFSVVRVEADSTQRLWSFAPDGTDPVLLLPDAAPVGYHAWIDASRLALFVLGEPSTLRVASLEGGEARIVARDVGRSLHLRPGEPPAVSFVQWTNGREEGWISELDPATGEARRIAPVVPGNEHHAWTPSGTLLSAEGSTVVAWRNGEWTPVRDLSAEGSGPVSRLAVSPSGDRLAVVVER